GSQPKFASVEKNRLPAPPRHQCTGVSTGHVNKQTPLPSLGYQQASFQTDLLFVRENVTPPVHFHFVTRLDFGKGAVAGHISKRAWDPRRALATKNQPLLVCYGGDVAVGDDPLFVVLLLGGSGISGEVSCQL